LEDIAKEGRRRRRRRRKSMGRGTFRDMAAKGAKLT
jgi:hypothetical protein